MTATVSAAVAHFMMLQGLPEKRTSFLLTQFILFEICVGLYFPAAGTLKVHVFFLPRRELETFSDIPSPFLALPKGHGKKEISIYVTQCRLAAELTEEWTEV